MFWCDFVYRDRVVQDYLYVRVYSRDFGNACRFGKLSKTSVLSRSLYAKAGHRRAVSNGGEFFDGQEESMSTRHVECESIISSIYFGGYEVFFVGASQGIGDLHLFRNLVRGYDILGESSIVYRSANANDNGFLREDRLFALRSTKSDDDLRGVSIFRDLPFRRFFRGQGEVSSQ